MTSYTFRTYKDNLHNTIIEQYQTSPTPTLPGDYSKSEALINRCTISDAEIAASGMIRVYCDGHLMGQRVGKGVGTVTELPEAFLYLNRAKGICPLTSYADQESDVRFINPDVPMAEEDANVITSKCYNQDMYDLPLFDLDWDIIVGKNTPLVWVNLPAVFSPAEANDLRELFTEFGLFRNIGWNIDDNTRTKFSAYLGPSAILVNSTWNWHMYVNQWTSHAEYMYQLQALEEYGLLDTFWVEQAVTDGYTTLRLPGVKKVPSPVMPKAESFSSYPLKPLNLQLKDATIQMSGAQIMSSIRDEATFFSTSLADNLLPSIKNATIHMQNNVLPSADELVKWYNTYTRGNANGTS